MSNPTLSNSENVLLFRHTDTTWFRHFDRHKKLCRSRIMILSYEWKGIHYHTEWYICLDCNQIGKRDKHDSMEYERI